MILRVEEYEQLVAAARPCGGAQLLARLEEVKRRHGGGLDDFEVPRARLVPKVPAFGARRGGK